MESLSDALKEIEKSPTTTLRVSATEFKPTWGVQPQVPIYEPPPDEDNMDEIFAFMDAEETGAGYNMRDEQNMDELFEYMGQMQQSPRSPPVSPQRPKAQVDLAAKADIEARIAKAINDGKQAQVDVDKIQAAYFAKHPEEAAAMAASAAAAAAGKGKGGKGKGKGGKGKGKGSPAQCYYGERCTNQQCTFAHPWDQPSGGLSPTTQAADNFWN
jgi:hypothetical protein